MSKKIPKSKQLPNQESGSAYSPTKIETPKKAARASDGACQRKHQNQNNYQNNSSIAQREKQEYCRENNTKIKTMTIIV